MKKKVIWSGLSLLLAAAMLLASCGYNNHDIDPTLLQLQLRTTSAPAGATVLTVTEGNTGQ